MMHQIRLVHNKIFPHFMSSPRPLLLKYLLRLGIGENGNPLKIIAWEVQILGTLGCPLSPDLSYGQNLLHREIKIFYMKIAAYMSSANLLSRLNAINLAKVFPKERKISKIAMKLGRCLRKYLFRDLLVLARDRGERSGLFLHIP